jgi:hypothetical protein
MQCVIYCDWFSLNGIEKKGKLAIHLKRWKLHFSAKGKVSSQENVGKEMYFL